MEHIDDEDEIIDIYARF